MILGLAAWTFLSGPLAGFVGIAFAVSIIIAVSILDDRSHVPVTVRLIAHVVSAVVIVYSAAMPPVLDLPGGLLPLPDWFAAALWTLVCVWMTNLYNFMDGMDGFAGGMAVFGFGTMGLLGYLAGDDGFAATNWIIAASAGGFLVWNFPPARIFMGDSGSATLGFLAGVMAIRANAEGLFPLWLSLLVFAPFVVDATLTLIRRLMNGERIWQAHRSHYYQRLVRLGWTHRRTVLWEYGFMLLCASAAVVAFHAGPEIQRTVMGVVGGLATAAVYGVHRLEGMVKKGAVST
jgi:UDP-N-acetylmuramyl pentapeptide phosphotransferase/UDP-N-acetylglucosamine-1-phosphate transferase